MHFNPFPAFACGLLGFTWMSVSSVLPLSAQTPSFAAEPSYHPDTLTITWQADPLTTMTVQWLSELSVDGELQGPDGTELGVWFSPVGKDDWKRVDAEAKTWELRDLPHYVKNHVELEMWLYRAHITGLTPGTSYRFRVGTISPEYRFRTAPADNSEPIVFVSGGDVSVGTAAVATYKVAAAQDPLFAFIGGDLSYADGHRTGQKITYLREWHEHMVSPGGYLIPFLAGIGNHEVTGGSTFHQRAPFFAALFDGFYVDGKTYNTIDFGDYLSLVSLDTNHNSPIVGEQTEWLAKALAERVGRPHVFAFYHVPAYPSHRDFEASNSRAVRELWCPLFEKYQIHLAFEHHDHTYKRTHPLTGNKVDPENGIVYIGDGAWGVGLRREHPAETTWYLAKSDSVYHFIKTTISGNKREHVAINNQGEEFDKIATGN